MASRPTKKQLCSSRCLRDGDDDGGGGGGGGVGGGGRIEGEEEEEERADCFDLFVAAWAHGAGPEKGNHATLGSIFLIDFFYLQHTHTLTHSRASHARRRRSRRGRSGEERETERERDKLYRAGIQ